MSDGFTHPRLNRERVTVNRMIEIYCNDHHYNPVICNNCTSLQVYAERRLEHCRYQENKPTCSNCPIHCYGEKRREQIREVMKYAGPKMIFRFPILAIRHLIDGRKKVETPIV